MSEPVNWEEYVTDDAIAHSIYRAVKHFGIEGTEDIIKTELKIPTMRDRFLKIHNKIYYGKE